MKYSGHYNDTMSLFVAHKVDDFQVIHTSDNENVFCSTTVKRCVPSAVEFLSVGFEQVHGNAILCYRTHVLNYLLMIKLIISFK